MNSREPLFYIEDRDGWPYLAVIEQDESGLLHYIRLRDEGKRPKGTGGIMNTLMLNSLIERGVADVTHIGGQP